MTGPIGDTLGRLIGTAVSKARVVGGQHGYRHVLLTLADGRKAFAKVRDTSDAPDAAAPFTAEASGLRWLAQAGAVAVPRVLAVGPAGLVIEMISPGHATAEAARRFGRDLARLHASGADDYGAPWPGFIASLPLGNAPPDNAPLGNAPLGNAPPDNALMGNAPLGGTEPAGWARWYAARRILPFVRLAADSGALRPADVRLVDEVLDRIDALAGPPEPPSRIHGDLWSGNVLWSAGQAWLIDPAAHGGHRETDLAMLALFGAPFADQIMAGYQETAPLAAGWQARVPLHQLHPLLVHACLFGASYREAVRTAARAALAPPS